MQIAVENRHKSIFKSNTLPVLLYAGQISNEPEWRFPGHRHDNLSEIIYISGGQGEFIIDNTLYRGCEGDILVYNRGVVHDEKSDPSNPLKTYFCGVGNLDISDVEKGCIIPPGTEPVIHTGEYSDRIEKYISNIFEECSNQSMGYECICRNLLSSLIVLILRIAGMNDQPEDARHYSPLGSRIKDCIDRNYMRDVTLDDIAGMLYISRDYLSHVFKNETGISPISYLISRRIGEARKLLLTTEKTVKQISLEVGYQNTGYFSMLFKKITGVSPGIYRKKNKKGSG